MDFGRLYITIFEEFGLSEGKEEVGWPDGWFGFVRGQIECLEDLV